MDAPSIGFLRPDPFVALSKARGGDDRWPIIVGSSILGASVFVLLPLLANVHASEGEEVVRFRVFAGLAWALVGFPTGFWVFFWLPDSVKGLIPELRARGVLHDPPEEPVLDEIEKDMRRRMDSGWWVVVGLVATIITSAVLVVMPDKAFVPGWLKAIQVVATAPLVFGAGVLMCRLVSATAGTVKALQDAEPRVIPLHGDDAGGWSPFGHRAAVLGRAAAMYGLVAILVNAGLIKAGGNPFESPASIATMVGFVALPPFVLWAWLFAPHRAMLTAREGVMLALALEFERASLDGVPRSKGSDAGLTTGAHLTAANEDLRGALTASADWLDHLERRRALLVKAYPVWPLGLAELRAIWATALLPIVTAVVGGVADLATGWISGG